MQPLKTFIKETLKNRFDIALQRHSRWLADTERLQRAADDILLLKSFPNRHASALVANLEASKSQLRQDLFVLSQLEFKTEGYFVEFGATNGVDLSNTHLLEKSFGWKGLLAEPARVWHRQLHHNRSAAIETQCVWKESGATLTFNEVEVAELSTINDYSATDLHEKSRRHGTTYDVSTISLVDLLDKHGAPRDADYLSIDTEGSEYEILSAFDFDRCRFKVITCEHNHTPMRERLFELLTRQGYERKFEQLSRFDDWYVRIDS